ncbi:hypothetical protein ASG33_15995 [Dyadobacter sp. Leaf189]|nr:hypothetical protein ASG33_15995 [Dyadobacter sp. Leaf189]
MGQNSNVNYPITSSTVVTAVQTITASSSISGPTSVVTFTAAQTINFINGFTVSGVSNFTAQIGVATARTSAEHLLPEDEGSSIKIYPNPIRDLATIQISGSRNTSADIVIYNLKGEEVSRLAAKESKIHGEREATFDATPLPPGLYIVEITEGEKRTISKLLKH